MDEKGAKGTFKGQSIALVSFVWRNRVLFESANKPFNIFQLDAGPTALQGNEVTKWRFWRP